MMESILLAEDDPTLRDLAALALNRSFDSYQVITASDGLEALKTIQACHPVLVILDILLPHLNGLEVIRRLKDQIQLEKTIPIVTTSLGFQEVVEQAVAAGAKDFIIKPYDVNTLTPRVRDALDKA